MFRKSVMAITLFLNCSSFKACTHGPCVPYFTHLLFLSTVRAAQKWSMSLIRYNLLIELHENSINVTYVTKIFLFQAVSEKMTDYSVADWSQNNHIILNSAAVPYIRWRVTTNWSMNVSNVFCFRKLTRCIQDSNSIRQILFTILQ